MDKDFMLNYMYTIQKYLESNSVTLMIDRDKLTCICID